MNRDGKDSQTKNKQSSVWTNIQNGSMPIAGFQSGRPDIQPANAQSVPTGSSSGGVSATDRTYGIDPVGNNRQNIWVSNGSKINPTGVHKKYHQICLRRWNSSYGKWSTKSSNTRS